MGDIKLVSDLDEIAVELKAIFPNAIRGSVAKSSWGGGRKTLHLSYGFSSDTAFGYIIQAKGSLLYFVEWDTNRGWDYKFAESENSKMVSRIVDMFYGELHRIESPVTIINSERVG